MAKYDYHNKSTYFAADEAEETAAYLEKKAQYWFKNLNTHRYLDKLRRSWKAYHGAFYSDGHSITFGGETGEITNLPVNHYRNIAQHILTMVTSSRPAFQARSVNTDYKAQVQTQLANGLLDFYMRDKRLEKYLKKAVEYAIVLGSGYVKMEWNATSGEIYDYIMPEDIEDEVADYDEEGNPLDENGEILKPYPIYQGDVEFTNLSPFDVVFDSTKEDSKQLEWVLIRTFKNKYDLMAKYPERKDEIQNLQTKSDLQYYRVYMNEYDQTDDVPVYEFYHKKTESLPNGRYMLYLDSDIVLMDTIMPYKRLPVYRISAGDILGTPYGYTSMFDLLPIQDAVNSLHSTILTNQSAFGVQNILNPRGNDIRVNQIEGGLNFIEYNPIVAGGAPGDPKPLNLTNTPPEIFNYMGMLKAEMETLSGVNSVARGNPESSLKSGNALALVQSQALQFMNGLQQSYIMLIEDIGTGLVELLKDFAKVPRIAEISGKSNRTKLQEFTGEDIDSINRVIVDVGNSLSQTTAGKVQMADNLIQMGVIQNAEQYFSVINTGKLETMTDGANNQALLVHAENERLVDGTSPVVATAIDKHSIHIREHMNVLADPELRLDAELNARVLAHIQEHIQLLRETDPNVLAMIGEQPLGPEMGSPVAPGSVPQDQAQAAGAAPMDAMMQPPVQGTPNQQLPSPAQPPVDPATGRPFGQ